MKKKISMLLAVLLFFTMAAVPEFPVYAASLSVAVSNSSLNIGDTCSVTITVPNGGYAQVSLSYDSGVLSTDGGALFNISPNDSGVSQKTITFKAVGAGTASISANAIEAVDSEENPVSYGAAGASISVANAATNSNSGNSQGGSANGASNTGSTGNGNDASGSGETDGTIDTTNGDNSLSALSISGGTLSPAFSYNVTKYTAEVDYSVTSVAVSATPSNPSATVTSVTGNENLQVGANTITVVVKAGNGVTATYTITVTRKTEEESDNGDNPDESDEQQNDAQTKQFTIGGKNYTPVDEIPEEVIPADFTAGTVAIDGKDYACLNYAKADMTLLYMTAEGEEGSALFVYNANDGSAYPFIQLTSGSHYIIVLLPDESMIPSGYTETALQIEGKGQIAAYQKTAADENSNGNSDVDAGSDSNGTSTEQGDTENTEDDNSLGFYENAVQMFASAFAPEKVCAAEAATGDFYLLYALNDQGETYWYQYDNSEGTYQRYAKELAADNGDDNGAAQTADPDQIAKLKQKNRYLIFGMIFGAAVLLIIIINLLIARKDSEEEEDEEDDDSDDDEDDEDTDDNAQDDDEEDVADSDYDEPYDDSDEAFGEETYDDSEEALDEEEFDSDDVDEPKETFGDDNAEEVFEEASDEEDEDHEDADHEESDEEEFDIEETDHAKPDDEDEQMILAKAYANRSDEPENLDNTVSLEAAVKAIQTMVIPSSEDEDEQFKSAHEQIKASYHEENVRVVKRSRMDKFLDKKSRKNKDSDDPDDDDLEFLDIK